MIFDSLLFKKGGWGGSWERVDSPATPTLVLGVMPGNIVIIPAKDRRPRLNNIQTVHRIENPASNCSPPIVKRTESTLYKQFGGGGE